MSVFCRMTDSKKIYKNKKIVYNLKKSRELINFIVEEVKAMLAVKGIYNDGQVFLKNKLSIKSAEVIVVFPDSDEHKEDMELTEEAKRELFEEFSGSIDRIIDLKAEKMEALDERYESAD